MVPVSLLREIQDAAASDSIPVTALLRKCKILASRLKSKDFASWVELELNGYYGEEPVPQYRILDHTENFGNFFHPYGGSATNFPIPGKAFPEPIREFMTEPHEIRVSIDNLEDLLLSKDQGAFQIPWPGNIIMMLARLELGVLPGYQCVEIWRVLPRGKVVNILGQVRSKVLNFALDIENANPDAGEAPVNSTPVPAPVVQHIFNQHFHGAVGNIAAGSQNFSQQATVVPTFTQQNLTVDMGMLAQELPRVRAALAAEAQEPEQYEVLSSMRHAELEAAKPETEQDRPKIVGYLAKAGEWALNAATNIGATVAAEAIKQSMGLAGPGPTP